MAVGIGMMIGMPYIKNFDQPYMATSVSDFWRRWHMTLGLSLIHISKTYVCEVKDGDYKTYYLEPEQFGFVKCDKKELEGGTPEENAAITLSILEGEKGPRRDAVVLNSGAALYIAGKAESMEAGVRMAEDIISSGRAKKKLEEFIACSNS